MEKLKVGDRVKHEEFGTGKVIALSNLSNNNLIEFDKADSRLHDGNSIGKVSGKANRCYWCSDDELKLIGKAKPTLEELEKMPIGTKITTDAEGDNVFIKKYNNVLEFSSLEERYPLVNRDFREDLTIRDECCGTKIIKIEEAKIEYETIYDVSEETVEMTIGEIEEKLGHKVKVIKEEN